MSLLTFRYSILLLFLIFIDYSFTFLTFYYSIPLLFLYFYFTIPLLYLYLYLPLLFIVYDPVLTESPQTAPPETPANPPLDPNDLLDPLHESVHVATSPPPSDDAFSAVDDDHVLVPLTSSADHLLGAALDGLNQAHDHVDEVNDNGHVDNHGHVDDHDHVATEGMSDMHMTSVGGFSLDALDRVEASEASVEGPPVSVSSVSSTEPSPKIETEEAEASRDRPSLPLNMNIVLDMEREANPEFFSGSSAKTPERYIKIRNHILHMWSRVQPSYLSKTASRSGLRDCGDVNVIGRVHAYLEMIGAINTGFETAAAALRPQKVVKVAMKRKQSVDMSAVQRCVVFDREMG